MTKVIRSEKGFPQASEAVPLLAQFWLVILPVTKHESLMPCCEFENCIQTAPHKLRIKPNDLTISVDIISFIRK